MAVGLCKPLRPTVILSKPLSQNRLQNSSYLKSYITGALQFAQKKYPHASCVFYVCSINKAIAFSLSTAFFIKSFSLCRVFKRAARINANRLILVGNSEWQKGMVVVKILSSGKQFEIKIDELEWWETDSRGNLYFLAFIFIV